MAYTPPKGDEILFEWVGSPGAYIAPKGDEIVFDFYLPPGVIGPAGWNSQAIGGHTIYNVNEFLFPQTLGSLLAFGNHTIYNNARVLQPSGWVSDTFATPTVENRNKEIYPSGWLSQNFGTPLIDFDHPVEVPGISGTVWGDAFISNYLRFITPDGFIAGTPGVPSVTHGIRFLLPSGFSADSYGDARVGFRERTLAPVGTRFSVLGIPTVSDANREIFPVGIGPGGIGTPRIENLNRYLSPQGWEDVQYPNPFNLTVENYIRYIAANGWNSLRMTNPSLEQEVFLYIQNSGWDSSAFGSHLVYNKTQVIAPPGIEPGFVGGYTAVYDYEQNVLRPAGFFAGLAGEHLVGFGTLRPHPFGIAPPVITEPTISHGVRYLDVAGESIFGTLFGDLLTAGGTRTLDINNAGIRQDVFGTPFVSYANREIAPLPWFSQAMGTPVVDRTHYVVTGGFDSLVFGAPNAHDNTQSIFDAGGITGAFGTAEVSRSPRTLAPHSIFIGEVFGVTKVYNLRQRITQIWNYSPFEGGVFGTFNIIENRNKTLGATGTIFTKMGNFAEVRLAGRDVHPLGFDAGSFGATDISHYIRTVAPAGTDVLEMSRWANVYNAARALAPQGIYQGGYGIPHVESNLQAIKQLGFDMAQFGTAYADFRFRQITPYYSYESPPPGTPTVQLRTRYINLNGRGIAPKEVGGHYVQEIFHILETRGSDSLRMGVNAEVRNLTPELRTMGRDASEFGLTKIRLQYREVLAQGLGATLWGNNVIKDRRQTVDVPGFSANAFGPNTRITNAFPDPPSTRTLEAIGFKTQISPDDEDDAIGVPALRANSLFPTGFVGTSFGEATVRDNVLAPKGIFLFADEQFGQPTLNRPLRIDLSTRGIRQDAFGKPRLSPHTIWATFDVTEQAVENHGNRQWQLMDYEVHGSLHSERPVFGIPSVEHYTRAIFPRGDDMLDMDGPRVDSMRRVIEPQGFNTFRPGYPKFNTTRKIRAYGSDSLVLGEPSLENFLLNRTLLVQGWESFAWASPIVAGFIQEAYPAGIPSLQMGLPRIHPPEPIIPQGFDASVYGLTWISNYIRTVEPQGWVSFRNGDIAGSSNLRMTVRLRNRAAPPTLGDSLKLGTPTVGFRVRALLPAGIFENPIPHPVVTKANRVLLGGYGWDSLVFGDVDRWEPNKIKAHGDDMLIVPAPRINRTLVPSGIFDELLGTANVAAGLVPAGILPGGLGEITVTHANNDHVCGTLVRGIPVAGADFLTVGSPTVSG